MSSFRQATTALRRPDFARLWVGLGLSQMGSQVSQVAVAYQLYQLTHSALSLGLVGLFRFLPILAATFVAGPLADACDRRQLMLVTQSTLLLNSAVMAVLTFAGLASPALIYLFVSVSGLALAFDGPARQALIPNLVPIGELSNAVSLNITVFQVATVVGPSVGGALLALWGPGLAYAVDALTFGALIGALGSLRYRSPPRLEPVRVTLAAFREGVTFVLGNRQILWLMLLDFVATFFAGSLLLMPVYADRMLHVGAQGLGLLYAAPAAGAVIAALVMASRAPVSRQGLVVIGSVVAYGLAVAAFGTSRSFPLSLLFLACSGAADTVSMVVRNTVRQVLTPDSLRGRMTSLNQLFFVGGPQLGEAEAGLVARVTSAPFSVISGGLLCVGAALVIGWAVPPVRLLRRPVAAA